MGVFTFSMSLLASLLPVTGAVQYIDIHSGWTVEQKGPWQSRVDHRDLLAMHHPWAPSETGNFLMAWKELDVPESWGNSVTLYFYSSDDYHGQPSDTLPGTGFVGHRRKQILVNSTPVWTEDVSDAVATGTAPMRSVSIPVDSENRTVRVALLAYDVVSSTTVNREDFYRPVRPDLTRETDPDANRFRTTVYWGDLAFVSDDTPLPRLPRPSESLVIKHYNRFWPPEVDTTPWEGQRPVFKLSAPGGIPKTGFPLEMGIPLPEGLVPEPDGFRIADHRSRALFTQKHVSSTWPDGSLRWVLTQFPVKPGDEDISLAFSRDESRAPGTNRVEEQDLGLAIDGGSVGLAVGTGDPLTAITYRKKAAVDRVRLSLEVAGQSVPGTNDNWQVIDEGPFHTRLLLQGRFEGFDASLGSYAIYCSIYQGLPYIKLWYRYFNDTPTPQALSRLDVMFDLASVPESVALPHGAAPANFSLSQVTPHQYTVGDTTHSAEKPFFLSWSEGAVVVKDFSVLHPKAVRLEEGRLILSLVAGGDTPVTFTPGEACSHEIWLALGPTDGAQLAATVAQPPLLSNPDYYCASGVFGPAAPMASDHPWRLFLQETYGTQSLRELGMATGLRHYPDEEYLGRKGQWANNYNGRMESLWYTWLATGDRIWFDHALAVCRHLMDVAVVHSEVPGHDWMGALHGPGVDHVAGPWNPLLRGDGLALLGHLTGDPEAEGAFLGVADYCVRSRAGRGGPNVRHWAGPFSTIVSAYRDTGEIPLLEAGGERMAEMAQRFEHRRGTWVDWHGSSTYPGNIPWMGAQLTMPLYIWYRQTGDLEAAKLLVGLADSFLCENTPWDNGGAMGTYSPDPHFPETSAYDPFIIALLGAAYELTEDGFYRDGARALWERWRAKPEYQSVFNLGWHMPWFSSVTKPFEAPATSE